MLRTGLTSIVLVANASFADDTPSWPQFRGPLGTGVAPDANPPTEWGNDENIRFRVSLPGMGHGSPVVWGDRVFVTSAVPFGPYQEPKPCTAPGAHDNTPATQNHRYVTLAVDRTTGEVLWQRALHEEFPHEGGHNTGSLASASPVVDAEHVFAYFGSRGLYCLDHDGTVVWQKDLGEMWTKHAHGEGASPALHDDTLVINWDEEGQSFVAAFDKSTGEERWTVERDEVTSWATPIVVEVGDTTQVVVSGTKRLRGYDIADGSVIWECGGLSHNVVASPVAGDGMVFAGSSYERQSFLGIRLEGASGDLGTSENLLWFRRRRTPYVPSPLLYDGALYFMTHYQAMMNRVVAETGEEPTRPIRLPGISDIYASPVAADGRIYIVDRLGTTLVLKAGETPTPITLNQLDDSFSATPAIVGTQIILRGEHSLFVIEEAPDG